MKLYIYLGLENEKVPKDVTHVIVASGVTVIRQEAFYGCEYLVSVIMGDNVRRIEDEAFYGCIALLYIRFSKILEYIGHNAFEFCESLEALFLPSTVKEIGYGACSSCRSMRFLILPPEIDLIKVDNWIINQTGLEQIAGYTGVEYDYDSLITEERSNRRVNEWLIHHMDDAPFHKLCYNSSITTKQLNEYLNDHGIESALAIDQIHGMTPLHMLSMNPHSPSDAIAALLDVDMHVAFRLDNQWKTSLEYARDYNVGGLVALVNGLCNRRNAA